MCRRLKHIRDDMYTDLSFFDRLWRARQGLHLQYYSLVGLRLKFRHALKLCSQLKVRQILRPLPIAAPHKAKLFADLSSRVVVLALPHRVLAAEKR